MLKNFYRQSQSEKLFVNTYFDFILEHILAVNTIKISKPEKGAMVENMICRMVQMGQVQGKISEQELIQLLESVNQQMPRSSSTVKFDRRRAALDSDEDI